MVYSFTPFKFLIKGHFVLETFADYSKISKILIFIHSSFTLSKIFITLYYLPLIFIIYYFYPTTTGKYAL